MTTDRNIILICLDTVRKDYFDRYCDSISSLSDVSFEQCRAVSSWSAPSHASMISGQLPHQHGVHSNSAQFDSLAYTDTVFGDLEEYYSIGISGNKYAGPAFGFDDYFDEFHEQASHALLLNGLNVDAFVNELESDGAVDKYRQYLQACLEHDYPLRSVINGIHATMSPRLPSLPLPRLVDDGARSISNITTDRAADTEEPFFMFLNFMDAHAPHRPSVRYDSDLYSVPMGWDSDTYSKWDLNIDDAVSETYIQNFRDLYAASIDYLDRVVCQMITDVQAETDRPTTVVITADHGENLRYEADGGLFDHTSSLSEGLLHVPLAIVNPPEGWTEPDSTAYVSHLSLREILVALARNNSMSDDWFGSTCTAEVIGMSGIGFGDKTVSEQEREYWNRMIRCYYRDDRKYVWDSLGNQAVYHIPRTDPSTQWSIGTELGDDEFTDVIQVASDRYYETDIETYKQTASETTDNTELDSRTKEQLRELGYL